MKVVVIEDGVNIAAQMKRNIELYSDDTNVVQVLSLKTLQVLYFLVFVEVMAFPIFEVMLV
ncbi:MAG: hypothetical protein QNK68_06875 [Flavobacteriales bacterium]